MGHREALLEGAQRCLFEKGYARTTARDLVAASGTNLGSIGYHYGSKEALLDAALTDAITQMAQTLLELTRAEHAAGDFATAWQRIIDAFEDYRPLLVAQTEAWAQVERSEQLREKLRSHMREELARGAANVTQLKPDIDEDTAQAMATVTNMLADGLTLLWLIDADQAPSGQQIATGLRALADAMDEDPPPLS